MEQAAGRGLFCQRSETHPGQVGEEWLSVHKLGVPQSTGEVARSGGKERGRTSGLSGAGWPLGGDLDGWKGDLRTS